MSEKPRYICSADNRHQAWHLASDLAAKLRELGLVGAWAVSVEPHGSVFYVMAVPLNYN